MDRLLTAGVVDHYHLWTTMLGIYSQIPIATPTPYLMSYIDHIYLNYIFIFSLMAILSGYFRYYAYDFALISELLQWLHMNGMASQIPGNSTVYSVTCSGSLHKTQNSALPNICEGNPSATDWISSQKSSNVENVSTPWRYRDVNGLYSCPCRVYYIKCCLNKEDATWVL